MKTLLIVLALVAVPFVLWFGAQAIFYLYLIYGPK